MKRDEAKAIAMQQLEKVGMAHKADVYPITLSGGQKQRVAIAWFAGDVARSYSLR